MKYKAAKKLASLVKKPTAEEIIPHVTTLGLSKAVASVVR
jgi:malic enzyme